MPAVASNRESSTVAFGRFMLPDLGKIRSVYKRNGRTHVRTVRDHSSVYHSLRVSACVCMCVCMRMYVCMCVCLCCVIVTAVAGSRLAEEFAEERAVSRGVGACYNRRRRRRRPWSSSPTPVATRRHTHTRSHYAMPIILHRLKKRDDHHHHQRRRRQRGVLRRWRCDERDVRTRHDVRFCDSPSLRGFPRV